MNSAFQGLVKVASKQKKKKKTPRFEITEIKTIKTKMYANINYAYFKMKCAHSKEFREGSFRERKIYLIAKDWVGRGKAK